MNNISIIPTILCFSIIFIIVTVIGIYGTKSKIRYVSFINHLKKRGEYTKWSSENRIFLFLERISIYAFSASLFGIIVAGIFKLENIGKFLFICLIIFCLSAMISSFILYRKVPK